MGSGPNTLIGLSLAVVAAVVPGATYADCAGLTKLKSTANADAVSTGATCRTFLAQSGKTGVSCHWEHPFRDDAAKTMAERVWSEIMLCEPGGPAGPDLRVNHPDSYDLREWIGEGGTWSVSVKDKGALGQTLVFLKFAPTPAQ